MQTKIYSFILKFIFGSLLLFMAVKGCNDAYLNERYAKQSFSSFENYWAKQHIRFKMTFFRDWVMEIIFLQNLFIVYGALLLMFGQSGSRNFLICGIIIQTLILHNPILFSQKYYFHFFKLVGIIGGILYIK